MLKINVHCVLVANILPWWATWYIILRLWRSLLNDLASRLGDSRGGRNTIRYNFPICVVAFFELLIGLIKCLFLFNSVRNYKSLALSFVVEILMGFDFRNFLKKFKLCNVDQWFYIGPSLAFGELVHLRMTFSSVFFEASWIFSFECSYWQACSSWFPNMKRILLLCLIKFPYALSSLLLD